MYDSLVDAPDELLHLAGDMTGELPAIPVTATEPTADPSAT